MLAILGLVVGAVVGHLVLPHWGAALGGLVGFFAGAFAAGSGDRRTFRRPGVHQGATEAGRTDAAHANPAQPPASSPSVEGSALSARVAALEARVAELERRAVTEHGGALGTASAVSVVPAEAAGPGEQRRSPEAVGPRATAPDAATPDAATPATPTMADPVLATGTTGQDAPIPPVTQSSGPRHRLQPLAWLMGGNTLTRLGVVVLFIGVAFLLRYFADHWTLSIEAMLASVGLGGVALILLGWRLAGVRPGYAWSLQGAGAGVLYLTAFAAMHEFAVIEPLPAFALLGGICLLTLVLGLAAGSEALAALALTGAFLAPVLTDAVGEATPVLGYFAVVNAVVLALALRHSWRGMSFLAAVFTFALGLSWGASYYAPGSYAVAQPFLVLDLAIYIGVVVLHARRSGEASASMLDGLLVFGVPLAAFALQSELVADTTYGAACSALALAAVYGLLGVVSRRAKNVGLARLGRSFLALAAVFATLSVPFALDGRWTAAVWSIEGALVYWLGTRPPNPAARCLGMLVQLAAGALFLMAGGDGVSDRVFANAFFTGVVLVASAGFASTWLADRRAAELGPRERSATPWLFAWSAAWWLAGGAAELLRQLPRAVELHAVVSWVTMSAGLSLALCVRLGWQRLVAIGFTVAPVMAYVALHDLQRSGTTMFALGWLVWPAAWCAHVAALRVHDALYGPGAPGSAPAEWDRIAVGHAVTATALVTHIAWEASEWAGRITDADTVWLACAAALPAIAFLSWVVSDAAGRRWPLSPHATAYRTGAGGAIALALGAWVVGVNLLSPGEPHPLPWWPLLNPLDLVLVLALVALHRWTARMPGRVARLRFHALGVGLFVCVNGMMLRIAHHLGNIPWDFADLLASRPLQASLTLSWSATGAGLMVWATRRGIRPLWLVGATLLAAVVAKLFLLDFGGLAGLSRAVAFLGVGLLLLVIGYLSPLPPAAAQAAESR